jgi:hypothetical protein
MALQLFKIETVEVASPVTSITFSSIPQGYTDLIVKISARSSDGNIADGANIYLNNDTTTGNYSFRRLRGTGTSVLSDSSSSSYRWFQVPGNTATTNTLGNLEAYIPNYTSSVYKSVSVDGITENNGTEAHASIVAGLWNSTSAITSVTIASGGNYFLTNSTATLYGVL